MRFCKRHVHQPYRGYGPCPSCELEDRDKRIHKLKTALVKIANLDHEFDSLDGDSEWGQADCFHQALKIAKEAL